MEFKGTKGVWEIDERASRRVKCNDITIANCSQGQNGENEEEERANALLISKAPEMLEFLMELYDDKETHSCMFPSQQKKLKQLIKEATEL